MTTGTRIGEIVDAIAALGAGLGTQPFVVTSVWGAGTGLITDPNTGQPVRGGFPGYPAADPYSWFVLPGRSTQWAWGDATNTQITWAIEGRLYFPRVDLANAVRILTGFINPFAAALTSVSSASATLSDTCAEQHITSTQLLGDESMAWLSIQMSAQEVGVNFNA